MYAKIYDLGDYTEVTVLPLTPKRNEGDDADTKEAERRGQPNRKLFDTEPLTEEESLNQTIDDLNNQNLYEINEKENKERSARRAKTNIRRYIKRYKLVNMYTFTFAEELPLSKKAERCGHWVTREYKGKIRARWEWLINPVGERIQNNVYYNRKGVKLDLKDERSAYKVWEQYVRRLRKQGINFTYLVVAERQERGVIHFHVATNTKQSSMGNVWRYGWIGDPKEQVKNPALACHYLTKYIKKSIDEHIGSSNSRRRSYRRSLHMSIPSYEIEYRWDIDDLFNAIINDRTSDGIETKDVRIYTSEQFGAKIKWTVAHFSPEVDNYVPKHRQQRNKTAN